MANSLIFGKRYEDDYQFFDAPIRFRFAELHQIGELYCEAGFEIKRHRQTVLEITYIITGRGTIVADDREYAVEENDVFVSSVGQMHEIRADRGTPLRFCYLGFLLVGKQPAEAELDHFYRTFKNDELISSKALLTLFSGALEELRSKQDFYMTMVGAYIEQILVDVHRAHHAQKSHQPAANAEARMGNAAYMVVRYVDQHYRDIDDIRELASGLGYSYTYLAHVFKKKTGMTIGSYIIMKKMEEAKWLLRSGRMNVSQIAARFNYMSVQSFSNSFKKFVGISPADYQALSPQEAEAYNR